MNHFKIIASGDGFDVDAYAKSEKIGFDRVLHANDYPNACHPTNFIEKSLGDGRRLSVKDQDRIATEFLERYEVELAELAKYPGVEDVALGIQFRIGLDPGSYLFAASLSLRLMFFAVQTGVKLSFYVDFDPTDEWIEQHERLHVTELETEVLFSTSIIAAISSSEDWGSPHFDSLANRFQSAIAEAFHDWPNVEAVGLLNYHKLEEDYVNSGRCCECDRWVTDRARNGDRSSLFVLRVGNEK